MVEIKFIGTPEEVKQEAIALFGYRVAGVTSESGLVENMKQPTAKPKKVEAKPEEQATVKPAAAQVASTATPVPPQADDITSKMQAVLAQLVKAKGRQAVEALFKKYGATRGSEVKPEDREAFVAEARAQIG